MIYQRKDFELGKHGEIDTVETFYIADSRWFLERNWSRQKGFSWLFNFMSNAVDLAKWYLPDIDEVFAYGHSSSTNKEHGLHVPDFEDKHAYYFRFEGNTHHAGEYQNYIEYFAECLDRGETPKPDLDEGLQTVALMAVIDRSMKTGLPVKVSDILKVHDLGFLA
jgi:predicted dehydrogenase